MKVEDVILGQEVVVPKYGVGRVTNVGYDFPHEYIEVTPYVAGYPMMFDPCSVEAWPSL